MDTFTFGKAQHEDATAAYHILDEARNHMMAIGRHQWTDDYPSPADVEADIERGIAYLLWKDDEAVAYGAVSKNGEPEYNRLQGTWLSEQDYLVVHRLATSLRHRGQHLGRRFLTCVEQLCREQGICSIKIDTNEDNAEMLHLLPSLGYTLCGEVDYGARGKRLAYEKLLR